MNPSDTPRTDALYFKNPTLYDLAGLCKELERENQTLRACIRDDCDTDEEVRNLARPILGNLAVDGDSYGVPTAADIVESLIKKLKGTNAKVDT